MARYDWGWNREQGMNRGYGSDYSGWAEGWDRFGAGSRTWGNRAGGYGGAQGYSGYDREFGGFGRSYGRNAGGMGGFAGGGYSAARYGGDYTRGAGAGGGYGAGGMGGGGYSGGGFQGGGYGGYGGGGSSYGGSTGGYGGSTGAYDRGLYGGSYPTYGGFPGGQERGMYYGGRGMTGYGADYGRMGGMGRIGGGYGGGYDAGYAQQTFMPEEAYRRHPEYDRPQRHVSGRWPDSHGDMAGEMDDDEVRQAVRENLFSDSWISADSIEVEVSGGVVTMTGEVNDYMEARYAWDDAWETMGVRGVINQLTVRTDQPSGEHGDQVPQSSGGKRGRSGGTAE